MMTGTFGRVAFTLRQHLKPAHAGHVESDKIRINDGSGIVFARSKAFIAEFANSMMKRPARMARRPWESGGETGVVMRRARAATVVTTLSNEIIDITGLFAVMPLPAIRNWRSRTKQGPLA
jgi:hypothetical protein